MFWGLVDFETQMCHCFCPGFRTVTPLSCSFTSCKHNRRGWHLRLISKFKYIKPRLKPLLSLFEPSFPQFSHTRLKDWHHQTTVIKSSKTPTSTTTSTPACTNRSSLYLSSSLVPMAAPHSSCLRESLEASG